jgi:hypothetical protein
MNDLLSYKFYKRKKESKGGGKKNDAICDQKTYACNWVQIEMGKTLYKHHIISQEF